MLPGQPAGRQSERWDSVPRWEAWEEGLGQQGAGGRLEDTKHLRGLAWGPGTFSCRHSWHLRAAGVILA